ncbi:MAG: class I SAM-dependent methyltransferase [Anaerolineae bacterium]|jgi:tellurite methyltransferase|nr:class I SAM-dependent methyltransferase [Anaerolineae bacterium]
MSHPDALIWDDRYSNNIRWQNLRSPRNLVISYQHLIPRSGLVLDAACGSTPTGLHLARQGWQVIALDVSNAALRIAQSEVQKEALPISFALMDLTNPWLPSNRFDVVLNFYYLSRPLLSTYRKSIRRGGLLFFETFLRDDSFSSEVDGNLHHYLEPHELKTSFADWNIIHYEETQRISRSTERRNRSRRIAQLVARKPD